MDNLVAIPCTIIIIAIMMVYKIKFRYLDYRVLQLTGNEKLFLLNYTLFSILVNFVPILQRSLHRTNGIETMIEVSDIVLLGIILDNFLYGLLTLIFFASTIIFIGVIIIRGNVNGTISLYFGVFGIFLIFFMIDLFWISLDVHVIPRIFSFDNEYVYFVTYDVLIGIIVLLIYVVTTIGFALYYFRRALSWEF